MILNPKQKTVYTKKRFYVLPRFECALTGHTDTSVVRLVLMTLTECNFWNLFLQATWPSDRLKQQNKKCGLHFFERTTQKGHSYAI